MTYIFLLSTIFRSMKVKLLLALFFLTIHFGFSQTEKSISGKTTSDNYILQNVDVINKNDKKSTISDDLGKFTIRSKVGDTLIFYKKDHLLKEIQLTESHFSQGNISVQLSRKAEELEEVVITKIPSIKLSKDAKWEAAKLDGYNLEKAANTAKVIGVNMGTIENGMDLMRIGGTLISLFKKEKDLIKVKTNKIEFIAMAKKICDQNFFLKILQLEPNEIELFLQFCDADPQSKKVLEDTNVLKMMDFLSTKNTDFKKLKKLD